MYTWADLVRLYRLTEGIQAMPDEPRYNMRPGTDLPVIRVRDRQREVAALRWGFRPPWWAKGKPQPINATAEKLFESGMWRDAARKRRCVVPMTGFYEPKGPKDRGPRPQFYCRVEDEDLLSAAGIWSRWHDDETGEVVESFAIITVPANETVGELHPRMPAILDPDVLDAWLDPGFSDADALRDMLRPWDGDGMACWEVSRAVNKPGAEGEELIRPVEDVPQEPAGDLFDET